MAEQTATEDEEAKPRVHVVATYPIMTAMATAGFIQ